MDHVCTCLNGNGTIGSQAKLWRPLHNEKLNGMMDAFVKIPRQEGMRSLWSGLSPTLVMAVPNTVVYFTSYDQLKLAFGYKNGQKNSKLIPFMCGGIARSIAITVISPLELIRTKIQSEQMTYKQTKDAVMTSIRHQGWRSLWNGWGAMMWRDVPFSATYFTLYETMKGMSMSYYHTDYIPTWHSFIFGIIGGTICSTLTLPFDVVKTHRQVELGSAFASTENISTYSMLKKLYKMQGIQSWFSGLGPRVLKVAPACAIMISSYEYGKQFFKKHDNINTTDYTSIPEHYSANLTPLSSSQTAKSASSSHQLHHER